MADSFSEEDPSPAGIPVGTIVAFAADPKFLPSEGEWYVCDGSSWSIENYPELFQAIGYSNGGGGGVLRIPDLRGRFILGKEDGVGAGAVFDWKTATAKAPIQVELDQMSTSMKHTPKGLVGPNMIAWNNNSSWFPSSGGDKESRPVNTYLHYIIKVKSASVEYDDIPVGGVVPYGGSNNSYPPNFPAYLRCDGSTVDKTKVAKLAQIVGDKFTPKPSSNFTAPDLSGKFIRGVDLTGVNDPDAGTRNPAPDGSQGLGTWQGHATGLRSAGVNVAHFSTYSRHTGNVAGERNIKDENYSGNQTWKGGDKESRPMNAALYFYINSIDPFASQQVFPIGAIIAIPGTPNPPPDEATWVVCDGSSFVKVVYKFLYAAIGSTWGQPEETGKFNVPDLRGYFLRGADENNAPHGDPDRNERFSLLLGGSSSGAGSYQYDATARPHNSLGINISYPTSDALNSLASPVATDETSHADGRQTFGLTAKWDDHTAPKSVAVRFYIRAF